MRAFCSRLAGLVGSRDGLVRTHGLVPASFLSAFKISTAVGGSGTTNGRADARCSLRSFSLATGTVHSLPRRLADTTARDALCRISLEGLRAALHRLVRAAWRRKALAPVGSPVGIVALDGKATALPCINGTYAQTHHPESGLPYGLIRTVTCSLTSAAGRPCIDAIPIPAKTNEMGHFQAAFGSVLKNYGALFQIVTHDAGALSEANGGTVVNAGKEYLFRLRGDQRTMFKLASELLDPTEVVAKSEDHLDSQTTVTRTLVLLPVQPEALSRNGRGVARSRPRLKTGRPGRVLGCEERRHALFAGEASMPDLPPLVRARSPRW